MPTTPFVSVGATDVLAPFILDGIHRGFHFALDR